MGWWSGQGGEDGCRCSVRSYVVHSLGWFPRRALIDSHSVSRQRVSKDGGEQNEEEMVLLVSHLASIRMDDVELCWTLPRGSIRRDR